MLRSLVGSEMCIRDSPVTDCCDDYHVPYDNNRGRPSICPTTYDDNDDTTYDNHQRYNYYYRIIYHSTNYNTLSTRNYHRFNSLLRSSSAHKSNHHD
eukprot:TRINITY_DN64449_c0_g1_i1.p2 TRINITY_DN64449_c0_g1~~TRINITY_DN64449_c0_g1_i1.p2  ORF type:complete len:110 (-),score=45.87 TRINITY_DN64449_c0_g1_i1:140-430(-)